MVPQPQLLRDHMEPAAALRHACDGGHCGRAPHSECLCDEAAGLQPCHADTHSLPTPSLWLLPQSESDRAGDSQLNLLKGGGGGFCLKGRGAGNARTAAEPFLWTVKAVGGRLLAVGNTVGAGVGVWGCLRGRGCPRRQSQPQCPCCRPRSNSAAHVTIGWPRPRRNCWGSSSWSSIHWEA